MHLLVDIFVRSVTVYLFILAGLRLLGKRHVAQLSILDLVLILLISNAVQNAMVGEDSSLIGGLIAAITLIGVNYIVTQISYKFKKVDVILEGTPTLLIHNGQVVQENLISEKITEEELARVIREHGIEKISTVKLAIMELDGTVSVISKIEDERKIESFKHRRMKYQQKKI